MSVTNSKTTSSDGLRENMENTERNLFTQTYSSRLGAVPHVPREAVMSTQSVRDIIWLVQRQHTNTRSDRYWKLTASTTASTTWRPNTWSLFTGSDSINSWKSDIMSAFCCICNISTTKCKKRYICTINGFKQQCLLRGDWTVVLWCFCMHIQGYCWLHTFKAAFPQWF